MGDKGGTKGEVKGVPSPSPPRQRWHAQRTRELESGGLTRGEFPDSGREQNNRPVVGEELKSEVPSLGRYL
jgi:hypothetical protein